MIKNDKQYQITRLKLKEFKEAIENLKNKKADDSTLKEIQLDALNSQVQEFEAEILDYQKLSEGKINSIIVDSLTNIHEALIKGRIAKGWTQADLARNLNLKEQQIQRYEAANYTTASLPRIVEILDILGLNVHPLKIDISTSEFDLPYHIDLDRIHMRVKEAGSLLMMC
jgi:HTH-type transcriptional regulator/antitoxin HigA